MFDPDEVIEITDIDGIGCVVTGDNFDEPVEFESVEDALDAVVDYIYDE